MLWHKLMGAQSSGSTFKAIGLSGGVATQAQAAHANATHYAVGCYLGTSPSKGVVTLFTKDGTLQWQRAISAAVNITLYSVKMDTSGNVFVLCTVADATANVVLLKYNGSGTLQWQRKVSNASVITVPSASPQCLHVAADGSVYVYVRRSSTPAEANLLKYNTSGTLQWQRKWADANVNDPLGCTIDGSGNLYVSFGRGPIGNNEVQLRKVDSSGSQTASKQMNTQSWNSAAAGAMHFAGSDLIFAGGGFGSASLYRLNSSFTYQSSRKVTSSAFNFRHVGMGGGALLAIRDNYTGYCTADTSPDFTSQRTATSSLGSSVILFDTANDSSLLVLAGRARLSSASYTDAMLMCLDPLADTGTFAPITVASDSLTDVVEGDRTGTAAGANAAAASLTDAAGSLTDAAGTLTAALYS